jgi:hypothetical protein
LSLAVVLVTRNAAAVEVEGEKTTAAQLVT